MAQGYNHRLFDVFWGFLTCRRLRLCFCPAKRRSRRMAVTNFGHRPLVWQYWDVDLSEIVRSDSEPC